MSRKILPGLGRISDVAALARGGKTLVTGYTLDQLASPSRRRCRHFTTTIVKGKSLPVEVFDVAWEKSFELTDVIGNEDSGEGLNRLTLSYDGNNIEMSADTISSLTLGRSPECGLIVASPHASRVHCRIECNRGKFMLHDNSSNGTFVIYSETELFFHQERMPLMGEGVVSLGATAANNPDFPVRYSVAPGNETG